MCCGCFPPQLLFSFLITRLHSLFASASPKFKFLLPILPPSTFPHGNVASLALPRHSTGRRGGDFWKYDPFPFSLFPFLYEVGEIIENKLRLRWQVQIRPNWNVNFVFIFRKNRTILANANDVGAGTFSSLLLAGHLCSVEHRNRHLRPMHA